MEDRRTAPSRTWIFALLFALSLPLVTTRIYAVDEVQYFAYVRSAIKDGDFRFQNEFLALTREGSIERSALFAWGRTPTGRVVSNGTPGFALAWAPWFLLGELVARVGGWPTDGYSWPYVAAVSYGAAIYGLLGLLLLRDLARRHFRPLEADLATVAAWWATALPFYVYVTPTMAHATSLFFVSAFVWLWDRWRPMSTIARVATLGGVAGLAAALRETNVLLLLLPAADLLVSLWERPQRLRGAIRRAAALVGAFFVGLSPQLLGWYAAYGSPFPPASRTGFLQSWPKYALSVLASPDRGLLTWHPVWLLGIVGLVLLARRRGLSGPAWALAGLFTCQVLLFGSVANWSGGMAFGQRRLLVALPVVVLGVAELVRRVGRSTAMAVLAVLVWLNLSLLIQFGTGMIPRQGEVSWARIMRNHVTEVPARAWDIGRTYLLDRSSLTRESD